MDIKDVKSILLTCSYHVHVACYHIMLIIHITAELKDFIIGALSIALVGVLTILICVQCKRRYDSKHLKRLLYY